MIGQSKYGFDGGVVYITKLDPDAFAPNDADLQAVAEEMRQMLVAGASHLSFTVDGMRVEIEPDIERIMRAAIQPLLKNERIHR